VIKCPNCQASEFSGALFCSKCGAQLQFFDAEFLTSNIDTGSHDSFVDSSPIVFPPPPEDYADANFALRIMATGNVIHINDPDEITLGRKMKEQPIIPDVDLSPYHAYEKGVSRLHLSIRFTQGQFILKDLGSVNGTRINGKKVAANSDYTIHHCDIITLGKMKIQILIRE